MTIDTLPNTLAGITFKGRKTPIFSSRVLTARNGKEYRAQNFPFPKWKFELNYEFLREDVNSEFSTLLGFFLKQSGQYKEFYYDDSYDDTAVDQALGVGDDVKTDFRLIRSIGGFIDLIYYSPNVSAVYIDDVEQVSGWSMVASGNYGSDTIRFDTPPAAGSVVSASFTFYYVCRFLNDEYDFDQMWYRFWELQQFDFQTVF